MRHGQGVQKGDGYSARGGPLSTVCWETATPWLAVLLLVTGAWVTTMHAEAPRADAATMVLCLAPAAWMVLSEAVLAATLLCCRGHWEAAPLGRARLAHGICLFVAMAGSSLMVLLAGLHVVQPETTLAICGVLALGVAAHATGVIHICLVDHLEQEATARWTLIGSPVNTTV